MIVATYIDRDHDHEPDTYTVHREPGGYVITAHGEHVTGPHPTIGTAVDALSI